MTVSSSDSAEKRIDAAVIEALNALRLEHVGRAYDILMDAVSPLAMTSTTLAEAAHALATCCTAVDAYSRAELDTMARAFMERFPPTPRPSSDTIGGELPSDILAIAQKVYPDKTTVIAFDVPVMWNRIGRSIQAYVAYVASLSHLPEGRQDGVAVTDAMVECLAKRQRARDKAASDGWLGWDDIGEAARTLYRAQARGDLEALPLPAPVVEGLRKAAAPFAIDYAPWMDDHGDEVRAPMARVNFGQVRALRAALASPEVAERWVADRKMLAEAAEDQSLSDGAVRSLCLARRGEITPEIRQWAEDNLAAQPEAKQPTGEADTNGCHADRDGECKWPGCPQIVNRQSHCPLDTETMRPAGEKR